MQLTVDKSRIEYNKKLKEIYNVEFSEWDLISLEYLGADLGNMATSIANFNKVLDKKLEELKEFANEKSRGKFDISIENNAELEKYFNSRVKLYKIMGNQKMAYSMMDRKDVEKKILANNFATRQFEGFQKLKQKLEMGKYDRSFQYLILREALGFVYKNKVKSDDNDLTISKRVLGRSIQEIINLSDNMLKFIYDKGETGEYKSFKELYMDATKFHKEKILDIALDNVDTFGKGRWLKFDAFDGDVDKFNKNIEDLKAMVADTKWCTTTMAGEQLAKGDFYLFVDNGNKPHIAVKMNGYTIEEIRGILGGSAQELEDEYRDVIVNFLENNVQINKGCEWLAREALDKRLVEYNKAINEGKIDEIDIKQFIEDYMKRDFKAHYGRNNHKEVLKTHMTSNMLLQRAIINYINKENGTNYTFDEVRFCDVMDMRQDLSNVKVVVGDIDLNCSGRFWKNGVGIQKVFGNVNLRDSKLEKWDTLDYVAGDLIASFSTIISMKNLKYVGRDAYFNRSMVKNLDSLEYVGKCADFSESSIKQLQSLKEIGDYANFAFSYINSLPSLVRIGGGGNFWKSKIMDLSSLSEVELSLNLNNTMIESLPELIRVGGGLDMFETKVCTIPKLKFIGADANFTNSQISELPLLEHIGKFADFKNCKISILETLKYIGGEIYVTEDGMIAFPNLDYGNFLFFDNEGERSTITKEEYDKIYISKMNKNNVSCGVN